MNQNEQDRYEALKDKMRRKLDGREPTLIDVVEADMSLDQRLAMLEELGRMDVVERFKEWKPRASKTKKRGAPLDQRVAISVTQPERMSLDADLQQMKTEKNPTTLAAFIRNRAIGSVDIQGWRSIAIKAMKEIEETRRNQSALRKRKATLMMLIDDDAKGEEVPLYQRETREIQQKLDKISSLNEKRSNRLTGRMSMVEAETVKHRAQKLGISVSDYLRMMIFALEPDSSADAHMSYDAKMRFYLSILDVADNGWGEVPKIYNCSQCENYLDRIGELEEQLRQNQTFGSTT